MAYRLIVKDEAGLEAENAYLYYETQQPGLGERFLEALQKRFDDIS